MDQVSNRHFRQRRPARRIAIAATLLVAAALCGPARAQQWVGATGSWFDALNWNPAFVPVAGGNVIVSNGGTALLDTVASGGATSTPVLGQLQVGLMGFGSGVGTVRSQGVDLRTGALVVGAGTFVGGSFADGLVETTSAGIDATNFVFVGRALNAATPVAATGQVLVDGALQLTAPAAIEVGQMFGVGAGSAVNGRLVARDLSGTVGFGFLIVGNVTTNDPAQVGSRSSGEVVASQGGLLTLSGGVNTVVGTTFGTDRVSDGAGTRINEATGVMRIGGTLTTAGDQGSLLVGRAFGGKVDGRLEVGTLAMGADRFGSVSIGTATTGEAAGRVEIGGGTLRTGTLFIGNASGGSANGYLALRGADLDADLVLAGQDTGTANLVLDASRATVATDFDLQNGLLSLDNSLLSVGDELRLGAGATLRLGIDALTRGTGYGAIDTVFAFLGGALALDFSELAFGAGSMVFDLIVASGDIVGDFASLAFVGLDSRYLASTGILAAGGDEIYRLTLTRADVPEPGGLMLALLALALLARAHRARRAGPQR